MNQITFFNNKDLERKRKVLLKLWEREYNPRKRQMYIQALEVIEKKIKKGELK